MTEQVGAAAAAVFIYLHFPRYFGVVLLKKSRENQQMGRSFYGLLVLVLGLFVYIYVYDTHIRTLAWHYETTSYSSYYEYGYWYQRPEHHTT